MAKSSKIVSIIFIALTLCACRKTIDADYQIASEGKTMLDVSYGSDPKQKMDVYLPPNRTTNTNVIIFVHGGSFISGDKSQFNSQMKYLLAKGFAVLNINYRLVDSQGLEITPIPTHKESSIKVKDQVSDLSAAVDFAIDHADEWVMSNKRIGVAGHSAGATLALLYSYGTKNTNKVQVVSNIAASLDLTFTDIPSWQLLPPALLESAYRYTGVPVEPANEARFKEISPLYLLDSRKAIPTLTLFPENNTSISLPKQDAEVFAEFTFRLTELRVKNEWFIISGADHGLSRQSDWMFALDKTISFFNENLK